jgi:predicted NBD/HSP70 family sugar kinase
MKAVLSLDARHAGHLRAVNLDRILAVAMERPGPLTRQELSAATALSAPTICTLTAELVRRGLLREAGMGPSRGGRRPSYVEFNARHGHVLGIDVGAATIRLALADLRGEVLARRNLPTPSGSGPGALLARVAATARSLLREARVAAGGLLAVSAAAPGMVDPDRGMVVALVPNLRGWKKVPVAALLEGSLGAPVVVENDVNLAVLGERWRGAARGHDTCAFVWAGVGIGAGIVMGGELHRGHHSLAGEIGLMCLGPQFVERDFGARGCLETLADMRSLAARWNPGRSHSGESWIADLFEAARGGDRRARQAIDETATMLGIAVTNLSLVLDPSLIVFGGPLGGAMVEEIRRIVAQIIPAPPEILASQLGEDATLFGCLLTAAGEARARIRRSLGTRSA